MLQTFYFVPGRSVDEDIGVFDGNAEKIDYGVFKESLSDAYKYLNFNFPKELINKNVINAHIFSFCKYDGFIFLGRTAIVGKDSSNRHYPVTKIVKGNIHSIRNAIEEICKGNEEYKFPAYIIYSTKHNLRFKSVKYYYGIQEWKSEIENANANLVIGLQSIQNKTGKSIVFNPIEKRKYDVYYFYSKKKDNLKYFIIVAVIVLVLILGMFFITS